MMQFRKGIFWLDIPDSKPVEGYTTGETWNGYAKPYFTFEQAMEVLEQHRHLEEGWKGHYDKEQDAFYFYFGSEEELDIFPGKDIVVDGQTVRAYPIGAGGWVWLEKKD